MRRRIGCFFIALLGGGLILVPAASAFWIVGQTVHQDITREALEGLVSDATLQRIVTANAQTDIEEQDLHAAHFDSESFEAGGARLRELLEETVRKAAGRDEVGATSAFGRALHTLQDFYAHSTWVGRHCIEGEPNDFPIHPDIFGIANPDPTFPCILEKGPMEGYEDPFAVTTGYYPDDTTPPGKCSHAELNKDCTKEGGLENGPIPSCPRSGETCNGESFHEIAKALAVEHTRAFYDLLLETIRAEYPDDAEEIIEFFNGGSVVCATVEGGRGTTILLPALLVFTLPLLLRRRLGMG
ncbi:MAG: hypothetical protein D6812_12940 [Deltaproteobacteria bacterium]|nr:MAG: hypothetical protein D6812_12940 [Deltaproteobacteria bacterium]